MRKRGLLLVLGGVAALCIVLFFVNQWLVAKGQSLTSRMGANVERPEFVQVNLPFNLDVVYHVSDMSDMVINGGPGHLLAVQPDFTLRNDYKKDIRVHLPLLRASESFPDSTQYLFNSQLPSEWKVSKTITLKPGESFKISLPESAHSTSDDLYNGQEYKESGRWALVFGVPDGEDSDKYLVGTVLSNPIQWRNEIKNKSQK